MQRIPLRQSAQPQHSVVISGNFFSGIASLGKIVGTGFANAVCTHSQGEHGIFPVKQCDFFRHICRKCFAVAVSAEKLDTKPVVGTQLIHDG